MRIPSYAQMIALGAMTVVGSLFGGPQDGMAQSDTNKKNKDKPGELLEPFTSDKKYFQSLRETLDLFGVLQHYDSISTVNNIRYEKIHPRTYPGVGGLYDGTLEDNVDEKPTIGMNTVFPSKYMALVVAEELIHFQQDYILKNQFDDIANKSPQAFFLINLVNEADAKAKKATMVSMALHDKDAELKDIMGHQGTGMDIAIKHTYGFVSRDHTPEEVNAAMQLAFGSFFSTSKPTREVQKQLNDGAQPTEPYGTGLATYYAKDFVEEARDVGNSENFDLSKTIEAMKVITSTDMGGFKNPGTVGYMNDILENKELLKSPEVLIKGLSGDAETAEKLIELFKNLDKPTNNGQSHLGWCQTKANYSPAAWPSNFK